MAHIFPHFYTSLVFRPEILKQEIKVFFVKYNDPIYVKLEKLDIMIRLASQANIAQVSYCSEPHGKSLKSQHRLTLLLLCHFQVLAELKEYATEVDVDFVRKAVRAIGRCAIKVEVRNLLIMSDFSPAVF